MADPTYELRPMVPDDEAFLYALVASARPDVAILDTLPNVERDALLRSQFELQRRHYETHFPAARHEIVMVEGRRAGRLWVDWRATEARCLDVALVPAARGHGLGTRLFRDLMRQAAARGLPVTLHVEHNNPAARRFYERLGFVEVSKTETHAFLEWTSAS